MNLKWIAVALAIAVSSTALAKQPKKPPKNPACVDKYVEFSLYNFLFGTGPEPQANGCAPAVYQGGHYVGQDPDPNIRLQLDRDSVNEGLSPKY